MTERVWLTREDVDHLVEQAAQKAAEVGATRALEKLGLTDAQAANDIRELRSFGDAWRNAKKKMWETTVAILTAGFLAALVAGIAISTWRHGP